MKELLPPDIKASINQSFEQLHNGQSTVQLQRAEGVWEKVVCESSYTSFRYAYLQLWLFAMRHFPVLTGHCPRKDNAGIKPWTSRGDSLLRWHLHELAKEGGFDGLDTTVQNKEGAYTREAEKLLTHFFPPSLYSVSAKTQEKIAREMVYLMKKYGGRLEIQKAQTAPDLTTNEKSAGCGEDINFRCGVPFDSSFDRDRPALFLRYLYEHPAPTNQARYLTSFAVKQNTIFSFFGELDVIEKPAAPETLDRSASKDRRTSQKLGKVKEDNSVLPSPRNKRLAEEIPAALPSQLLLMPQATIAAPTIKTEEITAENTLIPYVPKPDYSFNTGTLTREEAANALINYYEAPGKKDYIMVIKSATAEECTVSGIHRDDQEHLLRVLEPTESINVLDRNKKLKCKALSGWSEQPGVWVTHPDDSSNVRRQVDEILSTKQIAEPRHYFHSPDNFEAGEI
ncbi:MAG: hypothetical protein Q9171_002931 [Xanthocarpia ochracea]